MEKVECGRPVSVVREPKNERSRASAQEHRVAREFAKAGTVSTAIVFAGLSISPVLFPEFAMAADGAYQTAIGDDLYWPGRGYFPAYPPDQPKHPIVFYGDTTLGYDDNPFRLSDNVNSAVLGEGGRDDKFALVGAGVRGDLHLSQQEFQFNVNADHYSFNRFSFLDRWLYAADANFLYSVGGRLTGQIGYDYAHEFPNFGDLQSPSRDVITRQYGHASMDFRTLRRLVVHLLAERSEYTHDDSTLRYLDNHIESGTAGLSLVTSGETDIGVQYKRSRGEYPNLQPLGTAFIDNRYTENESSFVVSRQFAGRSGINLRVGYTDRKHEQLPSRDFKGTTGRAQFRYAPTAKVLFQVQGYRELQAIEDLSASYALVRGGNLGPAWAPSSKLVFQASYGYEKRDFSGTSLLLPVTTIPTVAGPQREDTTRIAQASAGYRPNDIVGISLIYEHGNRSANIAFADYEYNKTTLRVTAAF